MTALPRIVAVIPLLAVACALLGGCGFTKPKKDAEAVLARHFQAIATNGFASAMADYSTQFFQKTSKEEWSKSLSRLSAKLGTYQSHRVTSWRFFKKVGAKGGGTTVSFQCQVTYSKYSATENFTLFKGLLDSDFKILSHNINSPGFLAE